jgi:chromosome segregation ATPase
VTPKKKQAHNVFKRLVDCLKDISDHEPEYADFERVSRQREDAISELEAIRLKLESKDKHINVLENTRKLELGDVFAKTGQLQQDMQKLTDKWNEEKKQLGKAHSAEMQKVKGELQKHLSEIASLSNEHDRAKREVQLTKAQLEVANQELAQWKAPLSILRPLGVEDL